MLDANLSVASRRSLRDRLPKWEIKPSVSEKLQRVVSYDSIQREGRVKSVQIDTEVALYILHLVKRPRTIPGSIFFEVDYYASNDEGVTRGTAQPTSKPRGSKVRIGLCSYLIDRDENALQQTVAHELKHAADFCNPRAFVSSCLWLIRQRAMIEAARENGGLSLPTVDLYYDNPFEIAARNAADRISKLSLPPVIQIQ